MRYLVGAILLLCTTLYATSASADGPIREIERYERVRYMDNYERNLRRDFERFRAAEARKARRRAAIHQEMRREVEYDRYLARKAKARRSRRFYEEERRYRPARVRYDERRYSSDYEVERSERRVRTATLQRCSPSITGLGVEQRFLSRAKRSALKAWGREVEAAYGQDYINPGRALNPRYICEPACPECTVSYICKYRAAPCRGEF